MSKIDAEIERLTAERDDLVEVLWFTERHLESVVDWMERNEHDAQPDKDVIDYIRRELAKLEKNDD